MTLINWIEIAGIALTLVLMGIPLLRVSKRVSDLEGAELVEAGKGKNPKQIKKIISSK
jgi:hypothetical protein